MMMMYWDIILIAFIWVAIIDLTPFTDEITSKIRSWMTHGTFSEPFSFKPFTCSLCMTFWSGVVYMLATHAFTLGNLAFVLLAALATPLIGSVTTFVLDFLTHLINELSDYFNL